MSKSWLTALLTAFVLASASAGAFPPPARPEAAVASPFDVEIGAAKAAMMGDPASALDHARKALDIAQQSPDEAERILREATAHWLEGEALSRLGHPDEAKPIIDAALAVVSEKAPGTKLNGDLLMSRGGIAAATGQVQLSLQSYQDAYKIYQTLGIARSQAIALQNIGSIYNDAGDYQRVLSYYEQSAEVYGDDPALGISAHNNRGRAFKELGQYGEALTEFRQALALAEQMDSPMLVASIMTNIASAQYLSGDWAGADATALDALGLTKDGPAAGEARFLWGVRAQVALARDNEADAVRDIARTFDGIELSTTTMPFRDFHKAAYDIYKKNGDAAAALAHLEAYKRLDDQGRALATSTNSALMAAQFDYANQQLRISTLKAGQLEKEQELAQSRTSYRLTVALVFLIGSSVIVTVALTGFFKIRRSRNETRAANVQLNAANGALAKAVRARTEFLAMTSHEIRTPLNGILGMTQVMLMDPDLAPDARSNVEIVHGAGQTMKALVDDILDVAKMESGKLLLEARAFDLRSVLSGIGVLARAQAEAKGVAVVLDLEGCPARMTGDEQRLRQIAFNLMSNAVKFTEHGQVVLRAREDTYDGRRVLRLTVTDSGIGIPAEHLTRIFESFQQVDATISRRYGGTGLGLAICDNLARAMGGAIAVESEPGRGSTFTVTLPWPEAEDVQPHAATALSSQAVLIADGNLLRQSMVSAQLRKAGFDVADADDAAQADASLAAHCFLAVIVAGELLEVQTLDGLLRVRALRAAQPEARIVVLADEEMRIALIGCGADAVVGPATPPGELVSMIRQAASAPLSPATAPPDRPSFKAA